MTVYVNSFNKTWGTPWDAGTFYRETTVSLLSATAAFKIIDQDERIILSLIPSSKRCRVHAGSKRHTLVNRLNCQAKPLEGKEYKPSNPE